MGQDSRAEEDLGLPDSVQIRLQLQSVDLKEKLHILLSIYTACRMEISPQTILVAATFPSMNPFGMIFGVKISYR